MQVLCEFKNGVSANGIVFKPMIRLASDPNDTYQPYAMTNKELTDIAIRTKDACTDVVGTTVYVTTLYKQSGFAFLTLEVDGVTAANQGVIAKIPAGYRPPLNVSFQDTSGNRIRIKTDGDVIALAAFNNVNIRLTATWLIA